MLLVVVALILIQALSSSTRLAFFSNNVQPLLEAGDCLSALFTVIGLSLFLSYYGESTLTAFLTTLIITSLSILLQPMLLHFFVALLNDGFRNPLNTAVAGTPALSQAQSPSTVTTTETKCSPTSTPSNSVSPQQSPNSSST